MQVTIKYNDDTAFTVEEIVKQASHNYGNKARVEVTADSTKPHDLIYFSVQAMITHQQLSLLFDDKYGYQSSLKKLRANTLEKIAEIVDQVIIDNESRVA